MGKIDGRRFLRFCEGALCERRLTLARAANQASQPSRLNGPRVETRAITTASS